MVVMRLHAHLRAACDAVTGPHRSSEPDRKPDLQAVSMHQGELALDDEAPDRSALMATLDPLNNRYGRGAIALASTGQSDGPRVWRMKQSLKTPEYNTRRADVPRAPA